MTWAADVHIGTSGWHYARWIGPFYPPGMRAKEFLSYYEQGYAPMNALRLDRFVRNP